MVTNKHCTTCTPIPRPELCHGKPLSKQLHTITWLQLEDMRLWIIFPHRKRRRRSMFPLCSMCNHHIVNSSQMLIFVPQIRDVYEQETLGGGWGYRPQFSKCWECPGSTTEGAALQVGIVASLIIGCDGQIFICSIYSPRFIPTNGSPKWVTTTIKYYNK